MKQDKWTQQLHDKLAEHEMAAPEGLWADIEAAIQQQARPQRTRFIALRRWAVAASLVTALAGGGIWWAMHQQTPKAMVAAGKSEKPSPKNTTPESVAKSEENQLARLTPIEAPKAEKSQKLPISSTISEVAGTDTIHPTAPKQDATPETPQQTEQTEQAGQKMTITDEERIIRELDNQIAQLTNGHQDRKASVDLYAMNGFGTQTNSNGVRMSEQLANTYAYADNTANAVAARPLSRSTDIIYLAGYEERQKHHQPRSIGLTVSYPLTQRVAVRTGVVYTLLRSDFTNVMRNSMRQREQTLHYVGIPLDVSLRLWEHKGLKAYLSAGGQADWNVATRLLTEGVEQPLDKDCMQWSVDGSLGLQYDIVPQLGLYVEPGVKHYFDNGSKLQNYFKDKPTSFNLQVGLRWNLQK